MDNTIDNVQFEDKLPDRYACPLCKHVLKDPLQTSCGHRFCSRCLKASVSLEGLCPLDGENVNPSFQDISCQREINQLICFCNNHDVGCKWKGKLQNLLEHLTKCDFRKVHCPNPGCNIQLLAQDLQEHIEKTCLHKKIPCQWCKVLITQAEQKDHEKTCTKFPLSCPEGCGEVNIPRELMDDHIQNHCPLAQIVCPYSISGCSFKGPRNIVQEHCSEQTKEHLDLTVRTLTRFKKKLSEMDQTIITLRTDKVSLQTQLDDQREALAVAVRDMRVLFTKVDHIERTLSDQKNNLSGIQQKLGSLSNLPSIEQVSAQLEEFRLAIREHETQIASLKREATRAMNNRATAVVEHSTAGSSSARLDRHEHQLALHDINLAEQDIKIQMLEATSYEGMYIWKIDAWPKRLQEAKNGRTPSIYSPPFYVGRFGYKVCARAYPNGDGIGKDEYMSLFFVVMRGEYDALLPWPFHHKVTFRLLDQGGSADVTDSFRPDPNSSSFKKPTSDMNIASGCPTFIAHRTLRTRGYARDNTLFIKITVDTGGQVY